MLLELDRFWSIIEQSRSDFDPSCPITICHGNISAQLSRLNTILSELEPREIGAFCNRFPELFHDAYRWDLWAAGYIIEGGCSDDGFMDFPYCLVPVSQSTLLHECLSKAGVSSQLVVLDGAPHSFHLQPKQRDLRPVVIEFFDRHLKGVKAPK